MSIVPAEDEKFALLISGGQCSGCWIGEEIFYPEPSLSSQPWFFTEAGREVALRRYTDKFSAQSVIIVERKDTVYPRSN